MENLFKIILDTFRTHNIVLYVVAITSGLLSYNVLGVADLTGYTSIKSDYKNYIGLVFLVTTITVLVLCGKSILEYFLGIFYDNGQKKQIEKRVKKKINNLTNQEKAVLLQFFIQQSETIWLPLRAQEIVELINSDIINLASNSARFTLVGEAAMFKLPMELKCRLAETYPEIYSNSFDETQVRRLVDKFTPNSVIQVIRDRQTFGY
ncbi:super-infection exclusion protein B [uncultured Acinetobacter sp.]|uniref:super-infection exclusion protein B n=1 Tax=uncultured Acinetobacter sp. TaxID=165433 RepID=UPI0037494CCE